MFFHNFASLTGRPYMLSLTASWSHNRFDVAFPWAQFGILFLAKSECSTIKSAITCFCFPFILFVFVLKIYSNIYMQHFYLQKVKNLHFYIFFTEKTKEKLIPFTRNQTYEFTYASTRSTTR